MKRAFDVGLTVLTGPLWLPVLIVLAALVRRQVGRPVLFRQLRPGKDGRVFELLKFRTMTDARDNHGRLRDDTQRRTAFGRWLRSTSLDELPELINVLRGEMSLVGPRPLLVRYLPRYAPAQARRQAVRPGLTGLAQVEGRNALTWEEKFARDVYYVEHRSMRLDVRILLATVKRVILRTGIDAAGEAPMPEYLGMLQMGEAASTTVFKCDVTSQT